MPTTSSNGDFTDRGLVPVPDPTKLTTDAVNAATAQWRRDLVALQELISHQLGTVDAKLTARLDATDESAALRLAAIADVRPQTERQIFHLRELHEEKFRSIEQRLVELDVRNDQRFGERDVRTEQAAKAAKEALDAALLAAKELVGQQNTSTAAAQAKTEVLFTKLNDQTAVQINTLQSGFDARLDEIKERVGAIENIKRGEQGQQDSSRATIGLWIGVIGLVFVVVGLLVTLVVSRL